MTAQNLPPVAQSNSLFFNPLSCTPLTPTQRNVALLALTALACVGASFCASLTLSAWGAGKILTAAAFANTSLGLGCYGVAIVWHLYQNWRTNQASKLCTPPTRPFLTRSLTALGVMALAGPLGFLVNNWAFKRQLNVAEIEDACPYDFATLLAAGSLFGCRIKKRYIQERLKEASTGELQMRGWVKYFPNIIAQAPKPAELVVAPAIYCKEDLLSYILESLPQDKRGEYASPALAAVNDSVAMAASKEDRESRENSFAHIGKMLEAVGASLEIAYAPLLARAASARMEPLSFAVREGNAGFLNYLLHQPLVTPAAWQEALGVALSLESLNKTNPPNKKVQRMLEHLIAYAKSSKAYCLDTPLPGTEGEGETPLMYAARNGLKEVVQQLLQCGANPRLTLFDGRSAKDLTDNEEINALLNS